MPEITFDHVHIFTENMEQTVEFYKTLFKAVELRRLPSDQANMVHLSMGSSRIVVSKATKEKPVGIHHFAITTEQFDETVNLLKQQNCQFVTEISMNGIYRNVFFRDPNQILIELVSPATE